MINLTHAMANIQGFENKKGLEFTRAVNRVIYNMLRFTI